MRRRRSRTPPRRSEPTAPVVPEPPSAPDAERLAGYRLVRRIAAGERADVYLAAVVDRPTPAADVDGAGEATEGRGLVALRVYDADADADVITTEVEAMAVASALPALRDLATLADGRTCVVVERLGGPTLAAIAAGPGLTAGEAVTVLAPVIIAVHELERLGFAHVRLAMSDVMFDGSGRPRLIGTGGLRRLEAATDGPGARTALVREMYTALARLVGDVAVITRPPGALDPVRNLLAELVAVRPFRTHEEELERMLFAVAEPAPIVVGPGSAVLPAGGRRRRSADSFDAGSAQTRPDGFDRPMGRPTRPAALDAPVADANHVDGHQPPERGRGWLPRALSSFDALVDESVPGGDAEPHIAGRLDALRARIRRMLASRRPVLIVGGLAGGAALVLALTLLPPAPEAPAVGEAGAPIPATAAGAIPGSAAGGGIAPRWGCASRGGRPARGDRRAAAHPGRVPRRARCGVSR
jgi:hypothetical protein